ncbi:MAG: hypothetical protein O2854_04925 [Chloroflexi bacterium]|nr:hypothetical protein [Chloroflexota bacterium]
MIELNRSLPHDVDVTPFEEAFESEVSPKEFVPSVARPISVREGGGAQPEATAIALPSGEPVFFYDGEFRTMAEVQRRAALNQAIATLLRLERAA